MLELWTKPTLDEVKECIQNADTCIFFSCFENNFCRHNRRVTENRKSILNNASMRICYASVYVFHPQSFKEVDPLMLIIMFLWTNTNYQELEFWLILDNSLQKQWTRIILSTTVNCKVAVKAIAKTFASGKSVFRNVWNLFRSFPCKYTNIFMYTFA